MVCASDLHLHSKLRLHGKLRLHVELLPHGHSGVHLLQQQQSTAVALSMAVFLQQ